MKREYQKPSYKVLQITIEHHLLGLSGQMGGNATKPAKARDYVGDDNGWDYDDY